MLGFSGGTTFVRRARRLFKLATGRAWRPNPIASRELTRILDTPDLAISSIRDLASANLFISFTSMRHGLGGIKIEEFVGSTDLPDFAAIFVTDKNSSWYNNFSAEELTRHLRPLVEGKRIVTLGHSMGGFGAIWITRYLPVSDAIAFCPQFSVHPEIVPEERRWAAPRAAIREWRVLSLEGHFNSETRYVTVNGDGPDEMHWSRFERGPHCRHLVLGGGAHETAQQLKEAGVLNPFIAAVANGEDFLPLLSGAGLAVRELS